LISVETWSKVIEPLAKNNGLIEGATFKNLPFNRLHWNCRHEFSPTMVGPEGVK
jgi:ligand-binding SRPBCC domain-containing protein